MGKTRPIEPNIKQFFASPLHPLHRQFLALRSFYYDEDSAENVAAQYGYTVHAVYALAKSFKNKLDSSERDGYELFFQDHKMGRPKQGRDSDMVGLILDFRKKQLSVPDIKVIMDSRGFDVTEGLIYRVCDENGFARLPKRSSDQRQELMESSGYADVVQAPVSVMQQPSPGERFSSRGVGVLCFLPFIKTYGLDKAIEGSTYPGTKQIGKLNSILAFLALKLSNVARYGQDDGWCMDRGLGMFAGLNVLPKATWYSAYSDAVKRENNIAFLKSINRIFASNGLLSDSANLDFTGDPLLGRPRPI